MVTDWTIAVRLSILVVVAAAVGVPAQLQAVVALRGAGRPGLESVLMPTAFVAIVGVGGALVGSALGPRVGLSAPVLRASIGADGAALAAKHLAAGAFGGAAAALLLPLYYRLLPVLGPELFRVSEAVRIGMGLPACIAIGGVLEEIVFRWGALSLIAWVGLRLTGEITPTLQWISILGAALAFGAAHLPGAAGLGGDLKPSVVLVGLALNGWLGLVAGWLVWHWGLVAAIVAHSTAHIVWAGVEHLRAG